jgi:hypothetical protein
VERRADEQHREVGTVDGRLDGGVESTAGLELMGVDEHVELVAVEGELVAERSHRIGVVVAVADEDPGAWRRAGGGACDLVVHDRREPTASAGCRSDRVPPRFDVDSTDGAAAVRRRFDG